MCGGVAFGCPIGAGARSRATFQRESATQTTRIARLHASIPSLSRMRGFRFSPDGKGYGFTYTVQLDDLYLLEGLR